MPKFGKRSHRNLSECHPDLQAIFEHVVKVFDCTVIEGHRTESEQDKAYHGGKSKVRYPNSKHNSQPAMAADVLPYPINWNDTKRMAYFAGYVKGVSEELLRTGVIKHSVRWGGDWDSDTEVRDQSFHDLPHFELKH